jgi:NAD(P)-dependent dehydrogenase (short-subunit alcohol dehydrogenase family)
MENLFDLTGRVALIVGGARGIGFETARTLANAGADIMIADLLPEEGEAAAQAIRDIGRKSSFIETNVTLTASVDAMVRAALDEFGQIDILINSAGLVGVSPLEDTDDTEWERIMSVNLDGTFRTCRAVGKHMLERGSGAIVNIASMSGHVANTPQAQTPYNVSKAAVIMLTSSMAAEWATRGVRVNSVSPGYIATEMTKRGMSIKEWSTVWVEMTPMKRVGEPSEVAHAIWYLASDASKFATGTDLIIDGGYSSW